MPEVHVSRPAPKACVIGKWRERTGVQRVEVRVDPGRDEGTRFRVDWSRRWGYQIGDIHEDGLWLPREGAEELRDALTAALDWTPDEGDRA